MPAPLEGLVVRKSSRDLLVDTAQGSFRCTMRGRFRLDARGRSPAVVGDRVVIMPLSPSEGTLEQILPRQREVRRGTAGGSEVVTAANMEQFLILAAAREPPPRWALVDRMLACAERDGLLPAICLNKWDQVAASEDEARALDEVLSIYRGLGYPVFCTSAARGEGIEPLVEWLGTRLTVLSGHSGVGKSTLINVLLPGLELRTQEVTGVGKGRHTTTAVSLHRLASGGYVADTPGFREFALVDMAPAELGRSFREFQELPSRCRYPDCLHVAEPDCAVRQGVADGIVSKLRYENYLQILGTLREEG